MASKANQNLAMIDSLKSLSRAEMKVLKKRAELLAVPETSTQKVKDLIEILVFSLANETIAIESQFITKVIHLKDLTTLPCAPLFLKGIINFDGKILAVINLKEIINTNSNGLSNLDTVIILKHNRIELGILADSIVETKLLNKDEIKSNSSTINTKNEYVIGIIDNSTIMLDIKEVLQSNILTINQDK